MDIGSRMSKIQSFKRIIKEDYEEQYRALIDKFGSGINTFTDDVYNALNKGISIEDNLNQAKQTIKVTVDASGTPNPQLQIKSGLKTACYGIQVVRAINTTNSKINPTSQPLLSFSENNLVLTINNITGLQASNTYQLYLVLLS